MFEKIISIFFDKKTKKSNSVLTVLSNNRGEVRQSNFEKEKKTSLHEFFRTSRGLYTKNDRKTFTSLRSHRVSLKSVDSYR